MGNGNTLIENEVYWRNRKLEKTDLPEISFLNNPALRRLPWREEKHK